MVTSTVLLRLLESVETRRTSLLLSGFVTFQGADGFFFLLKVVLFLSDLVLMSYFTLSLVNFVMGLFYFSITLCVPAGPSLLLKAVHFIKIYIKKIKSQI